MSDIPATKKSNEVLQDLIAIRGIDEVFLVGRDGFVIESLMVEEGIDMDAVGASIAGAVARSVELESHLKGGTFKEMVVEYGTKLMICVPVGDIFAAVIASETSSLASIRFKLKKTIPASIQFG